MLKNVCLLEPRCIGHPPSPWLGSAVTGLGPALNARMLGSTTEQWGVGQHERFSPSVSKLVQFHKPSNHFPTIFNFWDKGLFDEFCLVKICKKCSKNQLGSPSILLRVPELEARILLRDSPPFSSPDVGENSSFLRHCIVKLWSSRWVFFRFFSCFCFVPVSLRHLWPWSPWTNRSSCPKSHRGMVGLHQQFSLAGQAALHLRNFLISFISLISLVLSLSRFPLFLGKPA